MCAKRLTPSRTSEASRLDDPEFLKELQVLGCLAAAPIAREHGVDAVVSDAIVVAALREMLRPFDPCPLPRLIPSWEET